MKFNHTPEFLKDLKRLSKKISSLEGDLQNFKKFIVGVDFDKNKRFITLHTDGSKNLRIIKTRLMVRSLKGSSKTRLIFSFCIHDEQIDFIEIYMKNKKVREDEERIKKYLDLL